MNWSTNLTGKFELYWPFQKSIVAFKAQKDPGTAVVADSEREKELKNVHKLLQFAQRFNTWRCVGPHPLHLLQPSALILLSRKVDQCYLFRPGTPIVVPSQYTEESSHSDDWLNLVHSANECSKHVMTDLFFSCLSSRSCRV
jgi:hypothetical protein